MLVQRLRRRPNISPPSAQCRPIMSTKENRMRSDSIFLVSTESEYFLISAGANEMK